jgi:CO/xanthine dehydrogenase Mo-binding subunit
MRTSGSGGDVVPAEGLEATGPFAANAAVAVGTLEVVWIDEDDPQVNPRGTKGIGELGNVGTAAAIANAVDHATGDLVRDLPITLDLDETQGGY